MSQPTETLENPNQPTEITETLENMMAYYDRPSTPKAERQEDASGIMYPIDLTRDWSKEPDFVLMKTWAELLKKEVNLRRFVWFLEDNY